MIELTGLMHVTSFAQSSPTTLVYAKFFSSLWHVHTVFTWLFFSPLRVALGIRLWFTICTSKARFGGKISQSDVNMHKSYFNDNKITVSTINTRVTFILWRTPIFNENNLSSKTLLRAHDEWNACRCFPNGPRLIPYFLLAYNDIIRKLSLYVIWL